MFEIHRNDARFIEEFDGDLLSFVNEDGIPWWYFVRDSILQEVHQQLLSLSAPVRSSRSFDFKAIRYCLQTAPTLCRQMHTTHDSKVAFFVPARYEEDIPSGKAVNMYVDYFASALPLSSLVLERASSDWQLPSDRLYRNVIGVGLLDIVCFGKSESRSRLGEIPNSYKNMIVHVVDWLMCEYGDKIDAEKIKRSCRVAYARYLASQYRLNYFTRLMGSETRLVLMIGGIYSENWGFVSALRKRGVVVAEMQHGAFSSRNVICSPSPRISKDSLFARGKPNYWLFYGSWWQAQTHMPSQGICIGNPYREARLSSLEKKTRDTIAVMGCAYGTENVLDFTNSLAGVFPEYRVIFRPHPLERVETAALSSKYASIEIDSGNLYETFTRCVLVVGSYSTVLFEAVGIAERVAVRDDDLTRENLANSPFPWVKDISDIQRILRGSTKVSFGSNGVWESDWRKKFVSFVDEVLS